MRVLKVLLLLGLSNLPVLYQRTGWPRTIWIALTLFSSVFYLLLHILPRLETGVPLRLSVLIGGYELVLCTAISFVIECGFFCGFASDPAGASRFPV